MIFVSVQNIPWLWSVSKTFHDLSLSTSLWARNSRVKLCLTCSSSRNAWTWVVFYGYQCKILCIILCTVLSAMSKDQAISPHCSFSHFCSSFSVMLRWNFQLPSKKLNFSPAIFHFKEPRSQHFIKKFPHKKP